VIELVTDYVVPAALALLPADMDSADARALLLAIGLQESGFSHRDQIDPWDAKGPALGLWQFERAGGVRGVLTHRATRAHAKRALNALRYRTTGVALDRLERDAWEAIEHNDVLAAVFARLNLWWLPSPLPTREEPGQAWEQYLDAWRPGTPKPKTWAGNYAEAWSRVTLAVLAAP